MLSKLLNLVGLGDPPDVAAAKQRMAADQADPRRRVVWGILAISEPADPGYMPELASTAIREWYGIQSAQEVERRVQDYLAGGIGTPAYDLFRAAFLARAGFGAGMLMEGRSWQLAFEAGRMMQRHYQTWQHYGMGYLEGHLAYRTSEGGPPARVAEIRQNLLTKMGELMKGTAWSVPFATPM